MPRPSLSGRRSLSVSVASDFFSSSVGLALVQVVAVGHVVLLGEVPGASPVIVGLKFVEKADSADSFLWEELGRLQRKLAFGLNLCEELHDTAQIEMLISRVIRTLESAKLLSRLSLDEFGDVPGDVVLGPGLPLGGLLERILSLI